VKSWMCWWWWEGREKQPVPLLQLGEKPGCEIQYVIDMRIHGIEGAQGWGGTAGGERRK